MIRHPGTLAPWAPPEALPLPSQISGSREALGGRKGLLSLCVGSMPSHHLLFGHERPRLGLCSTFHCNRIEQPSFVRGQCPLPPVSSQSQH